MHNKKHTKLKTQIAVSPDRYQCYTWTAGWWNDKLKNQISIFCDKRYIKIGLDYCLDIEIRELAQFSDLCPYFRAQPSLICTKIQSLDSLDVACKAQWLLIIYKGQPNVPRMKYYQSFTHCVFVNCLSTKAAKHAYKNTTCFTNNLIKFLVNRIFK